MPVVFSRHHPLACRFSMSFPDVIAPSSIPSVQSWADVLTPATVSQGTTECALKPAYESVFYATIAAPALASAIAMMILLISVAVRKDSPDTPPELRGCRGRLIASWKSRAPVAVLLFMLQLAYMPIVGACIAVFDCTEPIAGASYLRGDLRFPCAGSGYTTVAIAAAAALLFIGLGFPSLIIWKLGCRRRHDGMSKFQEPSFAAAWGFLFIGYRGTAPQSTLPAAAAPVRPLSSRPPQSESDAEDAESLTVENPLALSDLPWAAVTTAATTSSPGVTATEPQFGEASPSAVDASAARNRPATAADLAGRCVRALVAPRQSLAFWEATVLLRKMIIVLLARLVQQALVQVALFVVMGTLFLAMHIHWRPYIDDVFHVAEGLSLICIIVTAALAAASQAGPALSVPASLAITLIMLILNFATLVYLAYVWARLCSSRHVVTARAAATTVKKRLSVVRRASFGGKSPRGVGAGPGSLVSPGVGRAAAARQGRSSSIGRLQQKLRRREQPTTSPQGQSGSAGVLPPLPRASVASIGGAIMQAPALDAGAQESAPPEVVSASGSLGSDSAVATSSTAGSWLPAAQGQLRSSRRAGNALSVRRLVLDDLPSAQPLPRSRSSSTSSGSSGGDKMAGPDEEDTGTPGELVGSIAEFGAVSASPKAQPVASTLRAGSSGSPAAWAPTVAMTAAPGRTGNAEFRPEPIRGRRDGAE